MTILKVYEGHFEKQDGELRHMRFVKLSEVPSDLLPPFKGGATPRKYTDGVELVWDLDKKDFRAFNWSTVVGLITERKEEITKLR